jgi:Helix-turn-helix family
VTSSGVPEGEWSGARDWWRSFEPIHAVTYFADECRAALAGTGLRGFWMGYFAGRSVPLGTVSPATVAALFFGFDETMVRRALPDAWHFAEPEEVERARRESAATVLRRVCRPVEEIAAVAIPGLDHLIERADGSGRALFSANRDLPRPDDPVEGLWQGCTSLREHRGDGHVAALTTAGLDGCEALVLFALSEGIDGALFRASRGWSEENWGEALERLEARGLAQSGRITSAGRALRASIESTTDRLAAAAFDELHPTVEPVLRRALAEVGRAVVAAGIVPFPNPIGLPAPDEPDEPDDG